MTTYNKNIENIVNNKKSIYFNQNCEYNKLPKYIGSDSLVYKNYYIQNDDSTYFGKISETGTTMLLESESISISSSNTTFNGNVYISGNLVFSGGGGGGTGTSIPPNLFITFNGTFGQSLSTSGLSVSQSAFIKNGLSVSGNSTFSNIVTISGLNVTNNLTVTGNTTLNTLIVSGNSTFRDISASSILVSGVNVYTLNTINLSMNNTTVNFPTGNGNYLYYSDSSINSYNKLSVTLSSGVRALEIETNNLYIGGIFTGINSSGIYATYIAKYNIIDNTLDNLNGGANGAVNALYYDTNNSILYAGGGFTEIGGISATYVSMWTGGAWNQLGNGISNSVNAIVVTGSNVYVGCGGGGAGIFVWNGSIWTNIGGPAGNIYALALSGNDLYAGGDISVQMWNGSFWTSLPSINNIRSLAVHNGNVYAGSVFSPFIQYYDGISWNNFSTSPNGAVRTIKVNTNTNELYIGGDFTNVGNRFSKYSLTTNTWITLNSTLNTTVRSIAINYKTNNLNNPDVYLGGDFVSLITGRYISYFTQNSFKKYTFTNQTYYENNQINYVQFNKLGEFLKVQITGGIGYILENTPTLTIQTTGTNINLNTRLDYINSTIPFVGFQYFVMGEDGRQLFVSLPSSNENGIGFSKGGNGANFGNVNFYCPNTGLYKFSVSYYKQNDFGIARISIRDTNTNIVTNTDIDMYVNNTNKTTTSYTWTLNLTQGNHVISLSNVGNNPSSLNYWIPFIGDGIKYYGPLYI